MGENEYGKSGLYVNMFYLVYVNSFEALNDAFEVRFFRASFLHLIKDTDSM